MDSTSKIIPPHLNAEVYRTNSAGTNTLSYLDYINIFEDGSMLIGCSELTGRYWNGGACLLEGNTKDVPISKVKRNIDLTSGTADGCFMGSFKKVLLCDDNGGVSIWSTSCDSWQMWSEDANVAEHDAAIMAVDCLESEKQYVTCSMDGNIKVWDVNEMICTRNYLEAHSRAVQGVSVRPDSSTIFASGSLDQYITLWDENISKPVIDLIKNDVGIRCVQWLDENKLIYGDDAGTLSLLDARKPGECTHLIDFPAAVHRVRVHPEGNKVAVCCDNKIVSVLDVDEGESDKIIYHDRHIMHSNYVRGLAWDPKEKNILYSCGWDGELKTHNITW